MVDEVEEFNKFWSYLHHEVLGLIADDTLVLNPFETQCYLTGSSLVQDIERHDVDIVCRPGLVLEKFEQLKADGWEFPTDEPRVNYPNSSLCLTARRGVVNMLVAKDDAAYHRWVVASQLLSVLQLKEKPQRVALFQFMTEGHVRGVDVRIDGVFGAMGEG